ncbi:unnamed protein product [Caenorhabditis brenneri]
MSIFGLFRLPALALLETLKCFTPIELFELSQCSKKSSVKIRIVGKLKLELDFHDESIIINDKFRISAFEKGSEEHVVGVRKFQNNIVDIAYESENVIMSFWDDCISGLELIFSHFIETFDCHVEEITSDDEVPREILFSCLKIVPKMKINSLELVADSLADEDVVWILENVEITEFLWIVHKFSDGFVYNQKPLNAKCVVILHSRWVTFDNLSGLMSNCVMLHLSNSSWSNEEVVEFIDQWRAGMYSNFQHFMVQSQMLDENLKIKGLDALEDRVNPVEFSRKIGNRTMMIYGGVSIKRNDGSVGQFRYLKEIKQVSLFI